MKRYALFFCAFLLSLSAISLSAYAAALKTDQPTQGQSQSQGQPQDQPLYENQTPSENQTLQFNASDFGFKSPLKLGVQYSRTLGIFINAQYTHNLGSKNAFSILGELGKKQRRINLTLGWLLNPFNRLKLTYENLSQNLDFDFDSGKTSQWVYQNGFGATYQYLIKQHMIRALDFNAFYTKANSRHLDYIDYIDGNFLKRNYRRIAGATDKGGSLGLEVLPLSKSLVTAKLNYDDVNYDMRYQASDKNTHGFGATLSLEQILSKQLKLKLLASSRKPEKDYEADIFWLLTATPGTQLELELLGKRLFTDAALGNDTQFGLEFHFRFDGVSKSQGYSLGAANTFDDLSTWSSEPAVKMNQVLATIDQKTVILKDLSQKDAPIPLQAANDLVIPLYVVPGQPVNIDVTKYFPLMAVSDSKTKVHYKLAQGELPKGLRFDEDKMDIVGEIPKSFFADMNKDLKKDNKAKDQNDHPVKKYDFAIEEAGDASNAVDERFELRVNEEFRPSPFQTPDPIQVRIEQPFSVTYTTGGSGYESGSLFFDPCDAFDSLQIQPLTSDPEININPAPSPLLDLPSLIGWTGDQKKITISGIKHIAGIYTIKLRATNTIAFHEYPADYWSAPQTITIIVYGDPKLNLPLQHYQHGQVINTDLTSDIHTGCSGGACHMESVTSDDLMQYGLNLHYDAGSGHTLLTGTVTKPTLTERTIRVLLKNNYSPAIESTFKLRVSGPPVLTNPGQTVEEQAKPFTYTSIPLAEYFTIPTDSPEISDWELDSMKSQDGQVEIHGKDGLKAYGLELAYNQLRGMVLPKLAQHKDWDIYLKAKSTLGDSIDPNGAPATLHIHLRIG